MAVSFKAHARAVFNPLFLSRLVLARVQVPRLPPRLMIVELTFCLTLRTRPLNHVTVSQVNVDLARL
jgi:hypothetical protein